MRRRCRKTKFLSSLVHISWCVVCLSTISPVNNESSKNGRGYEELLYGTVIIARVSRGIRCRGRILNDRGSDQFMGYESSSLGKKSNYRKA